jgi:hypothetical protein
MPQDVQSTTNDLYYSVMSVNLDFYNDEIMVRNQLRNHTIRSISSILHGHDFVHFLLLKENLEIIILFT